MSVVTICGQLGSGAPEIGMKVACELRIDYLDRQIVTEVAAQLRRKPQDIVEKETPPRSILGHIAKALEYSISPENFARPVSETPLDDTRYLQSLKSVICEMAKNHSFVIYGQGSQFILRGLLGALHVLVLAPLEVRVKRVTHNLKLNEQIAKQEIERFDSSSRAFTKRYFGAELEEPRHYDLVINTNHLSLDAAASIIIDTLSMIGLQVG